jgi:hypothetical protein
MPAEPEAPAIQGQRIVVNYSCRGVDYLRSHEGVTHARIAERLAALQGFDYAGLFDPACSYPKPLFVVPSDTLDDPGVAHGLGISSETDLFGAIVPHRFVATKAITHSLVTPDAHAPVGWSRDFGERVKQAVLAGFSVFTFEDARRAARSLLETGPVRIKSVCGVGGRGQTVVSNGAELEAVLRATEPGELARDGLALEENLAEVVTLSVGQVRVGQLVASYHGQQRLTPDRSGAMVYGGSTLEVVRGGFDDLLARDLPDEVRLAVSQARIYDAAARELFPGLLASRRNYDIAQGLDASGRWRSGVLEQSWRIGGASGAEVAALEAFQADPSLSSIRASTYEYYGSSPIPSEAAVYFDGMDDEVGSMLKYTVVEPNADTRQDHRNQGR